MMELEKKRFMAKADIWFVSGILLIALLFWIFFHLNRKPGEYVQVSYDGTSVLQISLSQTDTKYYVLSEPVSSQNADIRNMVKEYSAAGYTETWNPEDSIGNYNVILYQDGAVQMIRSSCPDQICVHHGAVSASGENIICLPHKIVVEVIGGKDGELDGLVY